MSVFVDTSALFALLDEDDANHAAAVAAMRHLRGVELVTHAYVLVETLALLSRRLGWDAVERLFDAILPVVFVAPVDASIHGQALAAFREARRPQISFVDRTSFAFMRDRRLVTAFAFDADFAAAGFEPPG